MKQEIKNQAIHQRTYKITILFLLITLAMSIFLVKVFNTISSTRRIPNHNNIIQDRAFRGAIISADNYTLSNSKKSYRAVIRGASIVQEKRELFIKLFSIYSGICQQDIRNKFKKNGIYIQKDIILSKSINSSSAMQLKSLAYKLRKLGIFKSIRKSSGVRVVYGLDIIENGESREFVLNDVLSPILGYIGKKYDNKYIRPLGKKGLERAYNKEIDFKKNGYLKGKRDVLGTIIHDRDTLYIKRVDGYNLHLNIPLSIQRRAELMVDKMRENIDADEILLGIMRSNNGKVLALASSRRYDPKHIKDISALVPKFTEYPYEAGSVMKPLTLAIALDKHRVTPNTIFNTNYKRFHISKRATISDDEHFDYLSATNIIVHSSNIGISQIVWRLSGKEFREGLLKFGIAKKTGIDLSRDLAGSLKPIKKLNHPLHKANTAYGYGMMVTFTQLIKAYSSFNNGGIMPTPQIVNYMSDDSGKKIIVKPKIPFSRPISKKTANEIKEILKSVVKRGTGIKAQYSGLEIGGKTGTAHIAKYGHYVKEYHSSFYGFANDKYGNKYTIGVLVIRAKKKYKYFASESAVPTFRQALDILVELEYLKPDGEIIEYNPNRKVHKIDTTIVKTPKIKNKIKKVKHNRRIRKLFHKTKTRHIPKIKKSNQEIFEELF